MNETSPIQVIVADSDNVTREHVLGALQEDARIKVIGTATDGDSAVALAGRLKPDVILMDMKIEGTGGPEATEVISALLPNTAVIVLSDTGGPDLLRKAMVAGARQFLLKPINRAELTKTIYQVYQTTQARRVISGPIIPQGNDRGPDSNAADPNAPRQAKAVAFFSPKGGVGSTTLLINMAVAMCKEMGLRVAVIDGSLTFGDIGVFLDLPAGRSLIDLQVPPETIDEDYIESTLTMHKPSGLHVLMAPPRPEMADMVTGEQLRRAVQALRANYDLLLIDTWSSLDERVLTLLDAADQVIVTVTMELTAIKNAKMFLEVADLLKFPPNKTILVATQVQPGRGISVKDLSNILGRPLMGQVSYDSRLVVRSINQGEPLVLHERAAQVTQEIVAVAQKLAEMLFPNTLPNRESPEAKQARSPRFKFFART